MFDVFTFTFTFTALKDIGHATAFRKYLPAWTDWYKNGTFILRPRSSPTQMVATHSPFATFSLPFLFLLCLLTYRHACHPQQEWAGQSSTACHRAVLVRNYTLFVNTTLPLHLRYVSWVRWIQLHHPKWGLILQCSFKIQASSSCLLKHLGRPTSEMSRAVASLKDSRLSNPTAPTMKK
jgi:hypothetical protein